MKPFLLAAFIHLAPGLALACSCYGHALHLPLGEMGLLDGIRGGDFRGPTDLIFAGTVVLTTYETNHREGYSVQEVRLRFVVEKVFRGMAGDTIEVLTARGGDACGYYAPEGSTHVIYAMRDRRGAFYTSHCHPNLDTERTPAAFTEIFDFLSVLADMRDGHYWYARPMCAGGSGHPLDPRVVDAEFGIKDHQFHGYFRINDKSGESVEEGVYDRGKRTGPWVFRFSGSEGYDSVFVRLEVRSYKDGLCHQIYTATEHRPLFPEGDTARSKITVQFQGLERL